MAEYNNAQYFNHDKYNSDLKIAVIPAYEPEDVLIDVAQEAEAAGFMVIVVDDGSSHGQAVESGEKTAAQFEGIFMSAGNFATVLSYPENHGKGYAMKTAFRHIKDNYHGNFTVVVIDADGQHTIEDAEKVSAYAERHRSTLVLGNRRQSGKSPLRSRMGNAITRNVFRLTSGLKVYDTQTGLRAFSDELLDRMLEIPGDRYEYEMNMLMAFAKEKRPIMEVPIETIYIDGNKSSHFNTLLDSYRIYRDIFRFSASSFLSFLIDYGIFSCIIGLFGGAASTTLFANVFARFVSATANYNLNRSFVFMDEDDHKRSALRYAALAASILCINSLILYVLSNMIGITPLLAKLGTELVMFFFSFFMQKHFVFKKQPVAEKKTQPPFQNAAAA